MVKCGIVTESFLMFMIELSQCPPKCLQNMTKKRNSFQICRKRITVVHRPHFTQKGWNVYPPTSLRCNDKQLINSGINNNNKYPVLRMIKTSSITSTSNRLKPYRFSNETKYPSTWDWLVFFRHKRYSNALCHAVVTIFVWRVQTAPMLKRFLFARS